MRTFRSSLRAPLRPVFQQRRHFHPTTSRPFVQEVLEVSTGFVHGVHTYSGLPWALSIPLTAFIVRTTVALPLQIYTKVQARRQRDLMPLLDSWTKYYQNEIKTGIWNNSGKPVPPAEARRHLKTKLAGKTRALYRRWNVARFWAPLPFLQVPVWICVMESIRAMSGNSHGLVPYLLSLLERTPSEAGNYVRSAVEPSLATEGALWFPDLLAGDPTGILPLTLTLSILLNVRTGWKSPKFSEISELPRAERGRLLSIKLLKGFVQVLALNIGASSYLHEMPSALMIYWITSTNIATVQTVLTDKYMFAKPSLKRWKKMHISYTEPEQKPSPSKK
ncbi:putative mitochondrial export translocase Oxa2 [Aspergillus taichungensis]|uniref:Putative mitochondrial export translocase Oxa2 n=1 Tax=Aspergillus taichungensis TaxID=482145 RepID=A0A2J5HME4_9EURO|nr:putative mitochondrial export translocase Oxa2 [Aspergillus taichungensis]